MIDIISMWNRYKFAQQRAIMHHSKAKSMNDTINKKLLEINEIVDSLKANDFLLSKKEAEYLYGLNEQVKAYLLYNHIYKKAAMKLGTKLRRKRYTYLRYIVKLYVTISPGHCWE